jgi:glyoxylase-like metal-dependent hydrolase (beta-lactamase superfamily II)
MSHRLAVRIAAAILMYLAMVAAIDASAPLQKNQAPGFYRMMIGQFEVTALSDGSSPLPMRQLLTNIGPTQFASAVRDSFLEDPVETSVNAFLINTGTKLVLIDAGAGTLLGPRQGKLLENLEAAGYSPQQIDEVYLTHLHGDHVGGLTVGDRPAFPNATVRASRADADFWLNRQRMEAAPPAMRGQFEAAMASIGPYARKGRFQPFEGETTLQPGIVARPAPGHTPGHTIFVIESGGAQLDVLGDLVHLGAVQLAHPEVTIQFDTDPLAAVTTRRSVLAEASRQRYSVAGAHLPFPGIGHIRTSGRGYAFVPVNYTSVP